MDELYLLFQLFFLNSANSYFLISEFIFKSVKFYNMRLTNKADVRLVVFVSFFHFGQRSDVLYFVIWMVCPWRHICFLVRLFFGGKEVCNILKYNQQLIFRIQIDNSCYEFLISSSIKKILKIKLQKIIVVI